jgi:hypothetical protein
VGSPAYLYLHGNKHTFLQAHRIGRNLVFGTRFEQHAFIFPVAVFRTSRFKRSIKCVAFVRHLGTYSRFFRLRLHQPAVVAGCRVVRKSGTNISAGAFTFRNTAPANVPAHGTGRHACDRSSGLLEPASPFSTPRDSVSSLSGKMPSHMTA